MTRTIQDRELQLWEVYANPGDFGSAEEATMVFQCLSDPGLRARFLRRSAPRSAVEQEVSRLSDAQLLELLDGAAAVK